MRCLRFMLIALVGLFALEGFAQSNQKFAYANTDSIAMALPEFKQKQKELQDYGQQLNKELETMQKDFQAKLEAYQKNESAWIPEVLSQKQKELQQLDQNLKEFDQNSRVNISKKEQELLQPLFTKVTSAIEKVAKEKGYTHVLPGNVFLYKNEKHDLTSSVIKKLTVK